MKKVVISLFFAFFVMSSQVLASGFALCEPSTLGTAMGGALVGKAMDASANYLNPATLTDLTNITVTVGFVTEHPRARIKINDTKSSPLDPGAFILPHVQMAIPLPWDFAFGLGMMPEFGLGTHYTRDGLMTWSSRETTIQAYTINPNLAYKITDKWSVAAGLRFVYFDFEQYSYPTAYSVDYYGRHYEGTLQNHLHGNNDFEDVGWQVGTKYDILDNLSVGAVYKSKIDVSVSGYSNNKIKSDPLGQLGKVVGQGLAYADLELPQSVAFGCNWDITDDWHLGTAVSWTEWSSIDTLKFHLPTGLKPIRLEWKDTWRFAIAPSWDFAEDWTAILSYVYDMNCCPSDQQSSMLPPGDRQIVTGGLAWRITGNLECDLSYGLVIMGCKSMTMRNEVTGKDYRLECHRGLSHAVGFSVTYRF